MRALTRLLNECMGKHEHTTKTGKFGQAHTHRGLRVLKAGTHCYTYTFKFPSVLPQIHYFSSPGPKAHG